MLPKVDIADNQPHPTALPTLLLTYETVKPDREWNDELTQENLLT